ncbi:MAG: hypothetical protein IJ134_04390 [Bacilli bacterium]|nr:hypothetical protein [Bacilli bacterium]
MRKKIFIMILGIVMFIPIAHAKDVTKEEFVSNLQKYVEEFNSGSPTYEEYPYGSGIRKNMKQIILTNNDEGINLKNGDYETNVVFNETEQTVNGIAMNIDNINDNSTEVEKKLYYENIMYKYIQLQMIGLSIIDSKGIDKELGLSSYDVYGLRTGTDTILKDLSFNFSIDLSKVEVIDDDGYEYLVPKLSIEKLSDTKLRIYFDFERYDEERFDWDNIPIDLLIFEDSSSVSTNSITQIEDGYVDVNILPDKEYMFKGVAYHPTLLGYLRLSEPVYYNVPSQQDNQATDNNNDNNATNTQKTISNTIDNPKTGVKNYMTVGILAILILGITYKLYKKKESI